LGDIIYAQLPDVDTELQQFGKANFCLYSIVIFLFNSFLLV